MLSQKGYFAAMSVDGCEPLGVGRTADDAFSAAAEIVLSGYSSTRLGPQGRIVVFECSRELYEEAVELLADMRLAPAPTCGYWATGGGSAGRGSVH
jgi:hypothetical protein